MFCRLRYCERCGTTLQDAGRYYPGSADFTNGPENPVRVKREYQRVCVPCETQLKYGPLEQRDAFVEVPVRLAPRRVA